jgi:hypothetical protein
LTLQTVLSFTSLDRAKRAYIILSVIDGATAASELPESVCQVSKQHCLFPSWLIPTKMPLLSPDFLEFATSGLMRYA